MVMFSRPFISMKMDPFQDLDDLFYCTQDFLFLWHSPPSSKILMVMMVRLVK